MTIGDYILTIMTVLISFLTIVEKTEKIKWKPLSWLLGRSDTSREIKELKELIKNISDEVVSINDCSISHYKQLARIFISSFAEDLRKANEDGTHYYKVKSKGEFVAIMDLCNEYLNKNWNSEVQHDAKYIANVFESLNDKV